jgi:hypothetical protein
MNRLILILILTFSFQSLTKAEGIRDFQIEGMSLGDSALDYFTIEEINKNKKFYRNTDSKKFFRTEIYSNKFNTYDNLMLHFKENDPNYIIESISGAIFFSKSSINTTQKCIKKRNLINQEITQLFKNANKEVADDKIYAWDKSKKSKTHSINYWFEEGHYAAISCYVFSKEFDGTSHLKVMVNSADLSDWINSL